MPHLQVSTGEIEKTRGSQIGDEILQIGRQLRNSWCISNHISIERGWAWPEGPVADIWGVRLVGIRGHWVELLTWITIRRASAAIEFLHQQILNKITNVIVVCFPAPPPLHLQIDLYHITISIEYNVPCFKKNNWNKYKSKHHMSHCMQEGE